MRHWHLLPEQQAQTRQPYTSTSFSCLGLRCDVTRLFVLPRFLYENFQHFADLLRSSARQVGVVFGSRRSWRGPSDAASRSPWVKGENSENRVFWSVREKSCLLCSACLSLARGCGREVGVRTRICKTKQTNDKREFVQRRANTDVAAVERKRIISLCNHCGCSDTYGLKGCCRLTIITDTYSDAEAPCSENKRALIMAWPKRCHQAMRTSLFACFLSSRTLK